MPLGAVQPAIRADEHVLYEMACIFVMADEAKAEPIHRTMVSFDDRIERVVVAGQTGLDEFGVGGR